MNRLIHLLLLVGVVFASEFDYFYDDSTESTEGVSRSPVCELPAFTNMLPLNYRRELRKIWAGFYKATSKKCDRQLAQTRELVEGLPEELKVKVLEWGTLPVVSITKTNFLVGLSKDQTKEFSEIMTNRKITQEERYDLLRKWGSDYLDLDAVNQIEQFILFLQRKNKSFQDKVERLSPEAKVVYEKVESLRRMKQDLYSTMSESTKKELAMLFKAKCPRGFVWETSDLDSEELALACNIEEKKVRRILPPKKRTSTTTPATTTPFRPSIIAVNKKITAKPIIRKPIWTRIPYPRTVSKPTSTTEAPEPVEETEVTNSTQTTEAAPEIPESFEVPLIPAKPGIPVESVKPTFLAGTRTFVDDPRRLTELLRKLFPKSYLLN